MAIGTFFKDVYAKCGVNPAKTVKSTTSKITSWLLDAKQEKQSVDFLFYGDSNTGFAGDQFDLFNGIHDGWSRNLVDFGIKLYGSPIYFTGSNPNSYGLFSQPYIGTVNQTAGWVGTPLALSASTITGGSIKYGTGHLQADIPIVFSGTWSTGNIVAGTTYYIKVPNNSATTFSITDSVGNAALTVTGSGTNFVGTYTTGNQTKTIGIASGSGSLLTTAQITTCSATSASTSFPSYTITVGSNTLLLPGLNVNISGTGLPAQIIAANTYNICYSPAVLNNVNLTNITSFDTINGAVKRGTLDADPELVSFRNDFAIPTNSRYAFSSSLGSTYPNDVGGDDFFKFEIGSQQGNHAISMYNKASLATANSAGFTNIGWEPLLKGAITGRVVYAQTPTSADAYNLPYLILLKDGGLAEYANTTPLNASGTLSYQAAEYTLSANLSRELTGTEAEVKFGMGGSGLVNAQGKLAIFFMSLFAKDVIGFSASTLYFRGGAKSDDLMADLEVLESYNQLKKHQIFFREVVNRQKSASVKNKGRVCIVIQAGTNLTEPTGGPVDVQVANYIKHIRRTQELLTLAWQRAGLNVANLTFIISSGPLVQATQASEGPFHTALRKALQINGFSNAEVVDHRNNLFETSYVSGLYWSQDNSAIGQATPVAHLSDAGYIAWSKVIIANIISSYLPRWKKKK